MRRRISPRLTTVVAAHAGCAFFAHATAELHVGGARTRHAAAFAAGRRIHLGERAAVGGATVVAADLIRNDAGIEDRYSRSHTVTRRRP